MLFVVSLIIAFNIALLFRGVGRFLAARLTGLPVTKVAIGLGWELFGQTTRHGMRWSFCPLPIGGYLVLGEAPTSAQPRRCTVSRAIVLAAGPAANFLAALLLFGGVYLFVGVPSLPAVVHQLIPGGAGERAGLKPGDRIISADGTNLDSFAELQRIVRSRPGQTIVLQVQRGATIETLPVHVDSQELEDAGRHIRTGVIGVGALYDGPAMEYRRLSVPRALLAGTDLAFTQTEQVAELVLRLFGASPKTFSPHGGPLRIATANAPPERQIAGLLYVAGLLSLVVCLFSLLPLAMLDGGKLILTVIEAVTGKPLPPRVQRYLLHISAAILVIAAVAISWRVFAAGRF